MPFSGKSSLVKLTTISQCRDGDDDDGDGDNGNGYNGHDRVVVVLMMMDKRSYRL